MNGSELISGINTALNTALAGGGSAGDIVIPVYIGGDMIDEIVVTARPENESEKRRQVRWLICSILFLTMRISRSLSLIP